MKTGKKGFLFASIALISICAACAAMAATPPPNRPETATSSGKVIATIDTTLNHCLSWLTAQRNRDNEEALRLRRRLLLEPEAIKQLTQHGLNLEDVDLFEIESTPSLLAYNEELDRWDRLMVTTVDIWPQVTNQASSQSAHQKKTVPSSGGRLFLIDFQYGVINQDSVAPPLTSPLFLKTWVFFAPHHGHAQSSIANWDNLSQRFTKLGYQLIVQE